MKITITIDENLSDNTLLKVYYQEDDSTLSILSSIKRFVKDREGLELVLTGVTLLYIIYDKNLISGEELAINLYNKLITLGSHEIIVDETSSEPEYKWRIIKNSLVDKD